MDVFHNLRASIFGTPRSRSVAILDMDTDMGINGISATAPTRKRKADDDLRDTTAPPQSRRRDYCRASRRLHGASKSPPARAVSADNSRLSFGRRSLVPVTVLESPHNSPLKPEGDSSIFIAAAIGAALNDAQGDAAESDRASDSSAGQRASSVELTSSSSRKNRAGRLPPRRGLLTRSTPSPVEPPHDRDSESKEGQEPDKDLDQQSEVEDGKDGSEQRNAGQEESEPVGPAREAEFGDNEHAHENIRLRLGANNEDAGAVEALEANTYPLAKVKSPEAVSPSGDDQQCSEVPDDGIVLLQPDLEAMPVVLYNDVSNETYTIKAILKHRPNKYIKHSFELQVSWAGYKETSWEPERSIQAQAPELLYKYWSTRGGRPETGAFRVFVILRHWTEPGMTRAKRGRPSKGQQAQSVVTDSGSTAGRHKMRTKYEVQWEGYPNEKRSTSVETDLRLSKIAPEELTVYWEHIESQSKGGNEEQG